MSAVAVDVNNIKHKRRGLLTHPKLEPTPEFGITLAPQAELDGTNVVFGELIDGEEFLQQVEVLPVLQDATPGPLGVDTTPRPFALPWEMRYCVGTAWPTYWTAGCPLLWLEIVCIA